MQDKPYKSALGALLYMRLTRADLLQAISECARFAQNPGPIHWMAIKRIMRYLNGTRNFGLAYKRTNKTLSDLSFLELWVDSNVGGDIDNVDDGSRDG